MSQNTEESENSPESPHLGEITCADSVYQALFHFSHTPGTMLQLTVTNPTMCHDKLIN